MTSMNTKAPPFSSSNNEQTKDDSPEESSWTFYMQDFVCGGNINDDVNSFSTSGCDHQEISTTDHIHAVSDAFSSSGRKACDDDTGAGAVAAGFTSSRSNGRKLSFKRRKPNIGASVNEHDLEDTASSPANSPKVSYIDLLNFNQNEKDSINVSEENIGRNIDNIPEVVSNIDDEDENNHQSELKKKGLCLVPVSTLRNYFV